MNAGPVFFLRLGYLVGAGRPNLFNGCPLPLSQLLPRPGELLEPVVYALKDAVALLLRQLHCVLPNLHHSLVCAPELLLLLDFRDVQFLP
jgi:hypothetical protein